VNLSATRRATRCLPAVFGSLGSHGPWMESQPGRLSYRAFRTAAREGEWRPRAIEGAIPKDIAGVLYRNGPGQKEVFGVPLGHLFDGDAYITAIRFADGELSGLSRYVATAERVHEQRMGEMRFNDFGTRCPARPLGFKNAPSINVFAMADGHYALSEATRPVLIDPDTLACRGARDFNGSWPARTTFTAHPKRDPVTGDVFAYGITTALFPELVLFRMPAGGAAFEQIVRIPLGGFYPVHDFMLTETYLIVVLPPVFIRLWGMLRGRSSVADNIVAERDKPLRIFVARKDGRGRPFVMESAPANMIFHHCNAVESADGRTIRLISMETEGASAFRLLEGWGRPDVLPAQRSWMTELTLDLEARRVRRTPLTDGAAIEFPAIDNRLLGRRIDRIYALQTLDSPDDSLAFDALTAWDGSRFRTERAGARRVFGEPVVVTDAAGRSWVVHLGYCAENDETFLDIRDDAELMLVARAWLGLRIPLGFHGVFTPDPC
jgi:all-trans-8'-apo-beta-carotenal 15,15'-oxygenase